MLPRDAQSDYPQAAQIFAYGAKSPACDADCQDEELIESDDYAAQSMLEVAAVLSISAGKQVSVAMTVDKLKEEIQSDDLYKYLCLTIAGSVRISKYVGELSVYNYHIDNLTLSPDGLVMYKGSRLLVPKVLRPGLLKALHSGHPGVMSMLLRAKESFWWPGLKQDIENVRAKGLLCHEKLHLNQRSPVWEYLEQNMLMKHSRWTISS